MEKETCPICNGKGYIEKVYKTQKDALTCSEEKQCPLCEGYGFTISQGELKAENKKCRN